MKAHSPTLLHARTALGATAFFIAALTAIAQSAGGGEGGSGNDKNHTSGTTGTPGTSANEAARRNSSSSPAVSNDTRSSSSPGSRSSASSPTSATGSTYGSGTTGTAATGTSYGAKSANGTMSGSDKLTWGDKRFVTRAVDHGMAEVQVAELAAQQATNPDVKAFAQQLVQDHTAVNQELVAIASTKQVQIDQDDRKDRAFRRLSSKSGEDFDREFIEQRIDHHEANIKLFEKAAQDAKDQELRSFASKHVGHLREHLQKAQSLQASLVPTGRTDSTTHSTITGSGTTGTTHSGHATGTTGTGTTETSKPQSGSTPDDAPATKGTTSNDANSTDRSKRGAP